MIYMRQPKNIFAIKIPCYIWQFPSPSLGTVSWVAVHWAGQRVLNDLLRARLSRGRMVWLLAHPLPLLPSVMKGLVARSHTLLVFLLFILSNKQLFSLLNIRRCMISWMKCWARKSPTYIKNLGNIRLEICLFRAAKNPRIICMGGSLVA
jgi:hypothetical protein